MAYLSRQISRLEQIKIMNSGLSYIAGLFIGLATFSIPLLFVADNIQKYIDSKRMPKETGVFEGNIKLYVPVYQTDGSDFPHYPSFKWDFTMASEDEQLVASLYPDEILVLEGSYVWRLKDKKEKV